MGMRHFAGIVLAVAAAFALLGQGTGLLDLAPWEEPDAGPTSTLLPLGTPTALAAFGPFTDGEDGLRFPEPQAVGGLSVAQMTEGYAKLKKLLSTANLDPAVLFRNETEPYAKLLAPHQRTEFVAGLAKGTTRAEVTAFAPKSAEPTSDPIQVRGRATTTESSAEGTSATYQGALVRFDFEYVYTLKTGKVTSRRTGQALITTRDRKVEVWTGSWRGTVTGATCWTPDGYLKPATADDVCTRP